MTLQEKNLARIREALRKEGLEYVITRHDSGVAHINIWIGEYEDQKQLTINKKSDIITL